MIGRVALLVTFKKVKPKPQSLSRSHIRDLGHMQKKTSNTLTMTSNDRHIMTQDDFTTGLTRLDQQCNRTRTQTANKKKKPTLRIFENFCQRAFGTSRFSNAQSHHG
jgi:hypothetical protein